MRNTQSGFTLVELVLTIVLLGVLAATAVPRFADLGSAADASSFQAVKGNFEVGVALVHSTAIVKRSQSSSGYPDVLLEGQCIQVDSASGYPLVDQTTGTCNPVAQTLPMPMDAPSLSGQLLAWLEALPGQVSIVQKAHAVGPPPPPPEEESADGELPALLMEGDFSEWAWEKTPPTATLTSPESLSFTYNQTTGQVN